jgi:hypothetical protein
MCFTNILGAYGNYEVLIPHFIVSDVFMAFLNVCKNVISLLSFEENKFKNQGP